MGATHAQGVPSLKEGIVSHDFFNQLALDKTLFAISEKVKKIQSIKCHHETAHMFVLRFVHKWHMKGMLANYCDVYS